MTQSSLSLFRVKSRKLTFLYFSSVILLVAYILPLSTLANDVKVNSANNSPQKSPMDSSYLLANANNNKRVVKQVGAAPGGTVASDTDHQAEAGHHHHGHHGFGHDLHGHGHGLGHHGLHGDGKYFQLLDKYYIEHGPKKYEVGWVGQTPDGWEQRYERVDGHVKQGKGSPQFQPKPKYVKIIEHVDRYAHNPAYDEYEFGYRRGNDYHFQERYEKGGPYWNFKTKVKWGDKYAGYGEHYWDYNHQDKYGHGDHHGHGHGGGGGGGDDGGHGHGHYSEPVPTYENKPGNKKSSFIAKRQSDKNKNKTTETPSTVGIKGEMSDETMQQRKLRLYKKQRRSDSQDSASTLWAQQEMTPTPISPSELINRELSPDVQTNAGSGIPQLSLDPVTGKVYDESTGQAYWLKPAN